MKKEPIIIGTVVGIAILGIAAQSFLGQLGPGGGDVDDIIIDLAACQQGVRDTITLPQTIERIEVLGPQGQNCAFSMDITVSNVQRLYVCEMERAGRALIATNAPTTAYQNSDVRILQPEDLDRYCQEVSPQ